MYESKNVKIITYNIFLEKNVRVCDLLKLVNY